MRKWMLFAVAGLVTILGMQKASVAEWQGSMPPGDYGQTCKDMRMNGSILEARCQKSDGSWRNTSLDTLGCSGQVANVDGHLRCGQGNYGVSWQGGTPYGDYQQTCQDIRTNGPILEARCQKSDGGWRSTSLDIRACNGQVVNVDGHLRCGQGGYSGGQGGYGGTPSGDYQQTCRDISINGSFLEARCQKRDGDWRRTSLDMRGCGGRNNVINDDGYLRCGEANYGGGYGGTPFGDYQQTCQDIRINGSFLEARCQKRDGGWRSTSLDMRGCGGRNNVINDDGYLRCGEANYYQPGVQPGSPSGDYTQTCQNIRRDGGRLEADCQTRDGGVRHTSLNDYDDCRGAIINDDGHLRCQK
jgi:hypothetical protein